MYGLEVIRTYICTYLHVCMYINRCCKSEVATVYGVSLEDYIEWSSQSEFGWIRINCYLIFRMYSGINVSYVGIYTQSSTILWIYAYIHYWCTMCMCVKYLVYLHACEQHVISHFYLHTYVWEGLHSRTDTMNLRSFCHRLHACANHCTQVGSSYRSTSYLS